MLQSFSTDSVPLSDRLDAWLFNAQQICGECTFQFSKRDHFHGSIQRRELDGLAFSRFASTPVSFSKFPTPSGERYCVVITQLLGTRRYTQCDRHVILEPGDSTLIDSGGTWSSDCPGECARLYLRVPFHLMQSRLRIAGLPIARRICGASGLGAALFHLSTSFFEEADHLASEEGAAAVDAYLEILGACFGQPPSEPPTGGSVAEFFWRIDSYIEHHLADPALSPVTIANTMGISVRHLHRLFAGKGHTVADWIRQRRLQQCCMDMCDPRLRDRTITDIAFLWGFSDSAHFSHVFRRKFGLSPRMFRTRSWNDH